MENLRRTLRNYIENDELILKAVASNPRDREKASKLRVRPIRGKEGLLYQAERFVGTKVFHTNLRPEELPDYLVRTAEEEFRQIELETQQHRMTALIGRKGSVTIKEKQNAAQAPADKKLSHNRTKQYILPQDEPIPFLVELGVQTAEGRIVRARYDKFRQINRYLEFVRDILPCLPQREGEPLTVIDFGCGKSYLTFALYYYLKVMNGYDIRVIGLDLKRDVIENCQALADKFGYTGLKFLVGDIGSYEGVEQADMVVTLHACDTATDYALAKAVQWNASVILSVPCCQHELNRQIACGELEPLLKYGIVRERMAALITDALRANLLEEQGYETQLLEFIDMEHTPKNILIRAVKRACGQERMRYRPHAQGNAYGRRQTEDFLHVTPTLRRLLEEQGDFD
ncbi:MAG: SAM-dependent methyltransferase [Roseburia sp.]|nr:SAM-dependent methyltransferase [Roseburia sp.]